MLDRTLLKVHVIGSVIFKGRWRDVPSYCHAVAGWLSLHEILDMVVRTQATALSLRRSMACAK